MIQEPASEPRIAAEGIEKGYGHGSSRQPVLRGVTFSVDPGEFVVLLGVSGSGKTTLLNLIGAMDAPDAGRLSVCGTGLPGLSESDRARFRREKIGFVFQSYNLLPTLTALENIEAGLEITGRFSRTECRERARDTLDAVGLIDRARAFPAQLSGGEQQRVAVARALAKHPPLVLADEPTGNLDGGTGASLWSLMRALNRRTGASFLAVTHDPAAAAVADRVLVMRQGSLIPAALSRGTAEEELARVA